MTAHSIHNTLAGLLSGVGGLVAGTLFDWSGWFLMFLVVLWAIRRVQQRLRKYLRAEVDNGLITPQQYQTACSAWAQSAARLQALFRGSYRETRRFYQLCSELAHKKFQLEKFGNERHNQKIIAETRAELAELAPRV